MSEELLVSLQKAKSDLAKAIMSGVKERVEQVRRSFEVYFIYQYPKHSSKRNFEVCRQFSSHMIFFSISLA